jgi:T-complex protein 1 subunit beta
LLRCPFLQGENARLSSYVGAIAIADLVKTTLGPKGLDKMLQKVDPANSHGAALTVTNDGATILRSIHIDNAAAKLLVGIAKVQDEQVGDGTTSVAVLGGEWLGQAEVLEQEYRQHPETIAAGWRLTHGKARAALEAHAQEMAARVTSNEETLRANLLRIAETTLSSKLVTYDKKHFAKLAADAIMRLSSSNKAMRQFARQLLGRRILVGPQIAWHWTATSRRQRQDSLGQYQYGYRQGQNIRKLKKTK